MTMVSAMRSWTVCRFGWMKYWAKPNPAASAEAAYPSARSRECHSVR